MKPRILYVEKYDVPYIWANGAREFIKKCEDRVLGESLDTIFQDLMSGEKHLWVICDDELMVGALTTSIEIYPEGRYVFCGQLGGEGFSTWGESLANMLDQFAIDNDCKGTLTLGRKGTEKLYKPLGFEFEAVMLKRKVKT